MLIDSNFPSKDLPEEEQARLWRTLQHAHLTDASGDWFRVESYDTETMEAVLMSYEKGPNGVERKFETRTLTGAKLFYCFHKEDNREPIELDANLMPIDPSFVVGECPHCLKLALEHEAEIKARKLAA